MLSVGSNPAPGIPFVSACGACKEIFLIPRTEPFSSENKEQNDYRDQREQIINQMINFIHTEIWFVARLANAVKINEDIMRGAEDSVL